MMKGSAYTGFFWNQINLKSKVKRLPPVGEKCLLRMKGKDAWIVSVRESAFPPNVIFYCGNEVIKPKTGMEWVLLSELISPV